MQLYYAPGACSLADHIALHEADITFDRIKVDLKEKRTEKGENYLDINPKGYVPALRLDDGQVLTENVAVLSWIARRAPALAPQGELAPFRLIEMLAFISTELHKQFGALFARTGGDAEEAARKKIVKRLAYLDERLTGDYLFGADVSVADAYLFVMLRWARRSDIDLPPKLAAFFERMKARPAVAKSLQHEGLDG